MNQPYARFNLAAFANEIDDQRHFMKMQWKDVAKHTGVSPSTISRLLQSKSISLNSMACLAMWFDLDLNNFLKRNE